MKPPCVLLAAALWAGCATTSGDVPEPDYAADAETNLAKGDEALESKNFIEAERYFEYVKTKYPFLEAARGAELRLADTDFEREQFLEARDRYRNFIKLHPTHPKVDYAAFRAALTHHREIPSDFFLLPSSREKDQVEVRSTLVAMGEFIRTYPKSPYVVEAKKLADDARRRLAEHEMYVAEFYAAKEKWRAVVGRLNRVVNEFAGLGFEERAYFGLHEAYLKLSDPERAKESLRALVQKLPGTPAAQKAQKLLGAEG
ncbi:MAG: outer membrane protein assembly factor BamD [Myxococcales bacterium]|nr:outer membrane protein assembly factor BamD [Myxococcales bacterium]